ncbi:MAG: 30S ribosome-binding factor RbfA [Ignavibacteria bacterium]|jgi:ribosome-binding factor A|nr:30S ribosome-binding factor RbfA [Ignavibacteria bacterium]
MSLRTEKIGSAIKRALSLHISQIASANRLGLASVSMVKLSRDLSVASVFISVFVPTSVDIDAAKSSLLGHIESQNGRLRSIVAKEVRMRFIPELRFFLDNTLEEMERIDTLINKVKTDAPYKDDYGDESVYDV